METQAQLSKSTRVDEFRQAHIIWKEANSAFHDRFQEIISSGRCEDLDPLAQDLSRKFNDFMNCSKAFIAGK